MIKALLFDLDGTIIESTKELHYQALNVALAEVGQEFVITRDEHESIYDALSTRQKLNLLTERKGLSREAHGPIFVRKQKITQDMLATADFGKSPRRFFYRLHNDGFKLALCTNSIHETTITILNKIGITDLFDLIVTNEMVAEAKPAPDMYLLAMRTLSVNPDECLILEDSEHGIASAIASGGVVFKVTGPRDVLGVRRAVKCVEKLQNAEVQFEYLYAAIRPTSKQKVYRVLSKCVACSKIRSIEAVSSFRARAGSHHTGMCLDCRPGAERPSIRGKKNARYVGRSRTSAGYVRINIDEYTAEQQLIIAPMMKRYPTKKARIVWEHRAVMSIHLGRPLRDDELVHHKNGIRDDNRLENLELLTKATHHSGHGDVYYQKWQEAEGRIVQLESLLKERGI